jgi:hypothetical protein
MRYYTLDGHTPVPTDSVLEWGMAFEKSDRIVAKTRVGECEVSTVFLGINHRWDDGPPLLFETMIFGGPHDQYQTRSSTWEEAEEQHRAACATVKQEE